MSDEDSVGAVRQMLERLELPADTRRRWLGLLERIAAGDRGAFDELAGELRHQAPEVWRQLLADQRRAFHPLPGTRPIPPGRMMACPVDPQHYRTRRLRADERLRCPEHDVDLIPET